MFLLILFHDYLFISYINLVLHIVMKCMSKYIKYIVINNFIFINSVEKNPYTLISYDKIKSEYLMFIKTVYIILKDN